MNYFTEQDNTLTATLEFKNFSQCVEFANNLFNLYEQHDHHPDTLLHDYKKVTVTTTTHDAGNTVTEKDYSLVAAIEKLV